MVINDRFDADPLRNEVTDKQTDKINRIEPRLMKLLCLLAENEGKPVSRKMIIKEIWNDYPGGDEGLNQAISVLRKLLNDDKKKIIETLPKAGYCFHGTISRDPNAFKRKSVKLTYASAALFLLLVAASILSYYHYRATGKIPPGKLSHEDAVKAFKMDSRQLDSKENAISMDSAGKLDRMGSAKAFRQLKLVPLKLIPLKLIPLDSTESGKPLRTADERRREAGKADSRGK